MTSKHCCPLLSTNEDICYKYFSTGTGLGKGGYADWVMEACLTANPTDCKYALKFQDPERTRMEAKKSRYFSQQDISPKFYDEFYCNTEEFSNPLFFGWHYQNPDKENQDIGVLVTQKLDPEMRLDKLREKGVPRDKLKDYLNDVANRLDNLGFQYNDPKLDNFILDSLEDKLKIVDVADIMEGSNPQWILHYFNRKTT